MVYRRDRKDLHHFERFLRKRKIKPLTKKPEIIQEKNYVIMLGEFDKITYTTKINEDRVTTEVVSVTYSSKFSDKWEMVAYYDDVHGFLHRHRRVTLENDIKYLDLPLGVNSNDHKRNLRYALNDFEKNFYYYRRHLIKASKLYISENKIDIHYT